MFFHFHVPPQQEEVKKPKVELNINGEPKYFRTLDGCRVINDPTLVKVLGVSDWVEDPQTEAKQTFPPGREFVVDAPASDSDLDWPSV